MRWRGFLKYVTDDILGLINGFILEHTLYAEEVVIFASWFHLINAFNVDNDIILIKESTYYFIDLIGVNT